MFDAGSDAAISAVEVIVDDAAGLVAPRRSDRRDAAVAAVAEDDTAVTKLCHSVTGYHDVVAVTGPAAVHDNDPVGLGADEFALACRADRRKPMLNGETIGPNGALRMAPR